MFLDTFESAQQMLWLCEPAYAAKWKKRALPLTNSGMWCSQFVLKLFLHHPLPPPVTPAVFLFDLAISIGCSWTHLKVPNKCYGCVNPHTQPNGRKRALPLYKTYKVCWTSGEHVENDSCLEEWISAFKQKHIKTQTQLISPSLCLLWTRKTKRDEKGW